MLWDKYFLEICNTIAIKSPCLSRNIGAILVKDKSIVSTGFNGPARGIPHCGDKLPPLFMVDHSNLIEEVDHLKPGELIRIQDASKITIVPPTCPRKLKGYASGTHLEECPAQHAEENCISNAARNGVSTLGCILYLNTVIPCKNCFSTLINAGIAEIVCTNLTTYDEYTKFILDNSTIKVREFKL